MIKQLFDYDWSIEGKINHKNATGGGGYIKIYKGQIFNNLAFFYAGGFSLWG